ncbi:PREDICTED: uncharacterized protein LOC109344586 [Lupinus angustifolius]|uniref:uncharacterized protein LOC109344586 n=1 Tax=Lupinus angustifolius TaxID=3871 RepID=UPI00092EE627|nr:PREDICTED: uncharacterized protein LOC109344586 [Lupinus angustifolius]
MRKQFELLQMEDQESISEYFTRIRGLTNLMRSCGEQVKDEGIVEKALRTLSAKFDHVVVAIEESKDLEFLTIDELQGSLEAYEQRFLERLTERQTQQALSVQFKKKGNPTQLERHNRTSGKWHGERSSDTAKTILPDHANHREKAISMQRRKETKARSSATTVTIGGHFAYDCKLKRRNKEEEARLAKDEEYEEEVLLIAEEVDSISDGLEVENSKTEQTEIEPKEDALMMITTKQEQHSTSGNWYLDTGCSNHMTGHREWFTSLDSSVKTRVKFADDSSINAEGIDKISIKRKDGVVSCITNVLYVPMMKNNIISLGQLLEKDYKMRMDDRVLKIFNNEGRLILKAPLSINKTFKIRIHLSDHKCMKSVTDKTRI